MISKALMVRSMLFKNACALSRSYHVGDHKPSTMNDLPLPEGDWQEQYSQNQAKYNATLAIGIVVLAASIGFAKSSGLVHLNYSPPESID